MKRIKKPEPEVVPPVVAMNVAKWASEYVFKLNEVAFRGLIFGVEPKDQKLVRVCKVLDESIGLFKKARATALWIDLKPSAAGCGLALVHAIDGMLEHASVVPRGEQRQMDVDTVQLWRVVICDATRKVLHTEIKGSTIVVHVNLIGPADGLDAGCAVGKRQCSFEIDSLNRLGFDYAEQRLLRAGMPVAEVERYTRAYDATIGKPARMTPEEISAADAAFEGL